MVWRFSFWIVVVKISHLMGFYLCAQISSHLNIWSCCLGDSSEAREYLTEFKRISGMEDYCSVGFYESPGLGNSNNCHKNAQYTQLTSRYGQTNWSYLLVHIGFSRYPTHGRNGLYRSHMLYSMHAYGACVRHTHSICYNWQLWKQWWTNRKSSTVLSETVPSWTCFMCPLTSCCPIHWKPSPQMILWCSSHLGLLWSL